MNPANPLPSLICFMIALGTMHLLTRKQAVEPSPGRFRAIDGFRGYLAFSVFQSHSLIWFFFIKSGRWEVPPSHLYTHFGQSSVAFFFMITGFLFTTKLIDGRDRIPFDWLKLFAGRVMRLYPLYLVAGILHFAILGLLSKGATLRLPVSVVLKSAVNWLTMGQLGSPIAGVDFGGNDHQWILAGVTWTLPYEVLFYASLPLIGFFIGVRSSMILLAMGALGFVLMFIKDPKLTSQAFFLSGIIAAFLVRRERVRRVASSRWVSVLLVVSLGLMVSFSPSPYGSWGALAVLATVFSCVAAGNDFWGLLSARGSVALGEVSYGVYLLHGIALYSVFRLGIGLDTARSFTPEMHWLVVAATTPVLLTICHLSYRFIELPPMQRTGALVSGLRQGLRKVNTALNRAP